MKKRFSGFRDMTMAKNLFKVVEYTFVQKRHLHMSARTSPAVSRGGGSASNPILSQKCSQKTF